MSFLITRTAGGARVVSDRGPYRLAPSKREAIAKTLRETTLPAWEVAVEHGVSDRTVYRIKKDLLS